MRVLDIESVEVGSPLGQSLYNDRGDILAAAGVSLDQSLLSSIKSRGYRAVFIEDKQSEGIVIADPLTPETRLSASKATASTMTVGESTSKTLGSEWLLKTGYIPKSKETARIISDAVPADQIIASAASIVDEVLDAPTELGLNSIKSQDSFAYGHAVEVASIAVMLGRKIGLKKPDLRRLGRGALLHDIGQVFTGDTTDGKTGTASPADIEQVSKHTRLGYDFLQNVPDFDALTNHVAFQHHEWFNGKGYPRGLVGTPRIDREISAMGGQILPIAQITSIADVYDALCSDRPFRQRVPRELAMSLIKRMSGAQLQADLTRLFFEIVPIFPPGYPVRVAGSALDRWQGVVARVGSPDINRPIVRLFMKPDGVEVEPFEIDLAKDSTLRLMTAPPRRRVGAPA